MMVISSGEKMSHTHPKLMVWEAFTFAATLVRIVTDNYWQKMVALATQRWSIFLKLGRVGGPGDPNLQSKVQEDLTMFICCLQLKLGGVRGLKLRGDVGYFGDNLWWKDEPDPSKTVAVRSVYIYCHSCQNLLLLLSAFWLTTTEDKCWRQPLNSVQSSWNSEGSRVLVILITNPSFKKIWHC